MSKITQCGYVAIVGRPNVGKSTLLNHILGTKISITSRKPQTTRHRILGVKSGEDMQVVYVDTPGLHQNEKGAMNKYLNRSALSSLYDVDVIVMVVDCQRWTDEDEWVLERVKKTNAPAILALNKIDKMKGRDQLLPLLDRIAEKFKFCAAIPLSAKTGDQIDTLENEIKKYLPESPFLFPPDQVTDRSDQFLVSEMIREKLMRKLGEELPYALTVTIDAFKEEEDIIRIASIIWVEKDSQKAIVIGKGGANLKTVGQQARIDMEKHFDKKVYLQLWVKVKSGWSDNEQLLKNLGYEDL